MLLLPCKDAAADNDVTEDVHYNPLSEVRTTLRPVRE